MPRFLAEAYLAAGQMASLVQIVERLDTSSPEQVGVRRLATVYVASDETCLHMFDADTTELVAGACQTADVVVDRINPAVYIGGRAARTEQHGDLTLEPDPRRTP